MAEGEAGASPPTVSADAVDDHGPCSASPPVDLGALPSELLFHILKFVDEAAVLSSVEQVNSDWRRAARTDALWKALTLRGWSWLARQPVAATSWKQSYHRLESGCEAAFYVIGGARKGQGRIFLRGEWGDSPPMAAERNSAALARGSEGDLVVFGGRAERALATVERLCPVKGEWESGPAMATARCCPAAAAIDERCAPTRCTVPTYDVDDDVYDRILPRPFCRTSSPIGEPLPPWLLTLRTPHHRPIPTHAADTRAAPRTPSHRPPRTFTPTDTLTHARAQSKPLSGPWVGRVVSW